MPKITPIFLNIDTNKGFAFVHKSFQSEYVVLSYMLSDQIIIWNTQKWVFIKNITVSEKGVHTVYFTKNSNFLIVFLYKSTFI
jgi:hypothetical protein